jgi:hypothetical protein
MCRIISADNSNNMSFVAMKIDINSFQTKYRFGESIKLFRGVCVGVHVLSACTGKICTRACVWGVSAVCCVPCTNCTGALEYCRGLLAVQEVEEPSGVGGTLVSR